MSASAGLAAASNSSPSVCRVAIFQNVHGVLYAHTSYLSFFYTGRFQSLKSLHSKVRKFATKIISQQNRVNHHSSAKLHTRCHYVKVSRDLECWIFSEKYCGAPGGPTAQFFLQLPLTHYILRSIFFWAHPTAPICLKMPKCAIFGTFWVSGEKKPSQGRGPL